MSTQLEHLLLRSLQPSDENRLIELLRDDAPEPGGWASAAIKLSEQHDGFNLAINTIELHEPKRDQAKTFIRYCYTQELLAETLERALHESYNKESGNFLASIIQKYQAHHAIHQLGMTVYGGFLRDWIVMGERAKDIDGQIPPNSDSDTIHKKLMEYAGKTLKGWKMEVPKQAKGAAKPIRFMKAVGGTPNDNWDFDVVDPRQISTQTPPGVDCDVSNLALNANGPLHKKVNIGAEDLSIPSVMKHRMEKKFVFFYNPTDIAIRAQVEKRLKKYFERGYICLSKLPDDLIQRLKVPAAQLQPKDNWSKPWWTMGH